METAPAKKSNEPEGRQLYSIVAREGATPNAAGDCKFTPGKCQKEQRQAQGKASSSKKQVETSSATRVGKPTSKSTKKGTDCLDTAQKHTSSAQEVEDSKKFEENRVKLPKTVKKIEKVGVVPLMKGWATPIWTRHYQQ